MSRRLGLAGCILAAGLTAQGAAAATYRVGSCEVAPAPYATLAAALTAAQGSAGPHEVRVCPGAYAEAPTLSHANHAGLTLTSTTGSAADVTLNRYTPNAPLVTVSQPNITLRGISLNNPSNGAALRVEATASGFILENASLTSLTGHGADLRGATPRLTSITATTGGNYVGAVYLNGATGLVMNGSSTLTATATYGYGLYDSNSVDANPTLSGLTVSGGYGFYLRRTGRISLSDSSITATNATGAYLAGGSGAHVFHNLTLRAPSHGLQLTGGASAAFTDVDATSLGANYYNAALNISGVTGTISITASAKATVSYTATGASYYGISVCAGADNAALQISKAIITSANDAIYVSSSSCSKPTLTLSDLRLESSAGSGINLQSGLGAHSLARITAVAGRYGVYLNGGTNAVLTDLTLTSGNDGTSAGMAGLYLANQSGANLTGTNVITGRATGNYGIRLLNCDSCSITNAAIDMNGLTGSHGIHMDSASDRTSLSGHTVRNAPANGINALASRPTVHSNVVENSGSEVAAMTGGVALAGNGSAYNNCLYNSRNAYSGGAAFYTTGTGNFWGSWPKGSGYSDTCTDANGDAVCDTAYTYYGAYTDRYPLTACGLTGPVAPGSGYCAYIPSYNDGNLHIIDTATDARLAGSSAISLGGTGYSAFAITVKPDGSRAFSTRNSKNTFSVVNLNNRRLLKNYSVSNARAIALNPAGTRLYITRSGSKPYVSVYDASSYRLLKSVALSKTSYDPQGLAVSPNGGTVWAHNGRVQKINASNNTLTSTLSVTGAPGGLAVSPDGATVYAVKQNGSGSDGLHVITASGNTLARTINFPFANGTPQGIVLSPDGGVAWVALAGRQSVMKVTLASGALQEVALASLGAPAGVDVTPDGSKLYVGSSTGSNMAMVNTATLAVTYIGLVNKPAAFGRFIAACPGSAEPPAAPSGFNAFETDTPGGEVNGVIRTKVAATAFSLDLVALASNGGSVDVNFTGDVKVELTDASGGDACADRHRIGASATHTWASGDRGRKRVTFTETDAWANVTVRMSRPATGTPSTVACSVDAFAIRPASLELAATDGDWSTAGTTRSLSNAAASGGVIHKAGQPFTLTITARNSAGAVTGNYQGSPDVTLEDYLLPAACGACALDAGEFSGAGVLSSGTASYSDVGVIALKASDASFTSVDSGDSSDAELALESGLVTVGRFVPDHFELSPNSPAFTPACGTFTYLGQAFSLDTAPLLTVSARNAQGVVTENYAGSLWKLDAGGVTQAWSAATGTLGSVDPSLPAPTVTELGGGVGNLRFGVGAGLRFQRSALAAPFQADLSLTAGVTDSEGVTLETPPYTLSGIGFTGGRGELRFGRLRMANASGSERRALPAPVSAQYWTGQGFVTNQADACTSLPAPALTFFPQSADNRLASGETTASHNVPLIAGQAGLRLSAPGVGNPGYVQVEFNAPAWLRYNWDGTDQAGDANGLFDDNPHARASFGKRRGRDRIIIRRELY